LEQTNDLIFILNQNIEIEYINESAFMNLLGYLREDLIGKSPIQFIHLTDQKISHTIFNGNPQENADLIKLRIKDKNDNYHWYEFKRKIFIDHIERQKFLIVARKITKVENLEEKLNVTEEVFRTVAEQWLMGICIIQENRVKYLNQQLADLLGYTTEEILSWQPGEFFKTIHPDDRQMVLEKGKKRDDELNSGIRNYVARGVHKSGRTIWMEVWYKNIKYENRHAFLNTFIDITDKKIAEEKLIVSEKKYRHLFDNSPYFIGLLDVNGNLIDCNMTINEFMSLHNKENIVGKSFREILSLNEKNKYLIPVFSRFFIEAIKGNKVEPYEFELFRSMDDSLWLRIEGSLIELNNKKVLQFIIQNITERKQAEISLQQAAHHWSTTFNSMSDSVIRLDLENRIIQCNKATLDLLRKSNYYEIIGRPCWEVVHGTNKHTDWCPVKRMKITGKTESAIAQIGDIWAQISANPTLDDEGRLIGAVHVISDITEQKIAEEKLKKSEEKYRLITENANDMISITNKESKLEFVNESVHQKYLGYSKDEIIGTNRVSDIHPEDIQNIIDYAEELRERGESITELRFRRKDGKYIWLQMKGKNFIDIDGKEKTLSVSRDITDRKKIEQKLNESEKRYRLITDNSKEAVFIMDMNLKQTFASPASYEMLGTNYHSCIHKRINRNI